MLLIALFSKNLCTQESLHFDRPSQVQRLHCHLTTMFSSAPTVSESDRVRFEAKEYKYKPDAVISIDPLFNMGVALEKVEEAYKRLADFIGKKHYQNIAIKFHPRFNVPANKEYKDTYLSTLNKYFSNIYELPQDVVLENLLAWCKADFYSCDSSVALYAQQTGVKCYSMMPLLKDTPAYHPTEIMNKISEPIS